LGIIEFTQTTQQNPDHAIMPNLDEPKEEDENSQFFAQACLEGI